ncbi:ribonuclease HI [Natronobacillus azotifigens]|uniref:Reverse transcriptase-like protein n=1 Tax=Natronobacillus azotifigens TaxID=472978 RepID=A0A9J6RBG4_9BACI|nr:reverse transcriptase-like protein [Natronobacillus azotifigens]MCZ0702660.1 reverse transcriptase-like protein [Natronobacillus azotifigens]
MNVSIEIIYQTLIGTETSFQSEEMRAAKALLIAEDFERTGRAKKILFIDQHQSNWTMKEMKKFLTEIETEPHDIKVYFDGGFDLKQKKSGLGAVIYYQQNKKLHRMRINATVDELKSNNEAEYAAFHLGLQELDKLGVRNQNVTFIGDSQVVINQLLGEWPCLDSELNNWADRIERKSEQLGITLDFEVIARKENKEADQLATQALSEVEIMSTVLLD